MTEEMQELFGGVFLIMLIISSLVLIGFADKKNAVKDAVYSVVRFVVILLIGLFLPEPYNEYFYALTVVICVTLFPFLYFGLTEISNGKLQWITAKSATPVPTEKKAEFTVTGNDVYIKIEQMASLKEKGILSEEEFNEQKKKLLKV